MCEAQWDPAKHPRLGGPPNAGWFATTGGSGSSGGSTRGRKSSSLVDKIRQRNEEIGRLAKVVTPDMIRANRLATSIESAARLPREVARAAASGLVTGGKAVVNGFATSVKDVATLGLSPGQLDLLGVTEEDRERGYDTAVSISTGSGQVLIAVGTGGITGALSTGGSIARTAGGALVAYDAAGNAVGMVQGVYDASQNGVTIANGVQVGAGALGMTANIGAAKGLGKSRAGAASPDTPTQKQPSPPPSDAPAPEFRVGKHREMPSPRPGRHSHHGVLTAWMERVFPGYDANKAPAVLMPYKNHLVTYRVFNKWKARKAQEMGGVFDWTKVTEVDIRKLSNEMFDAAEVPASVREEYWGEFERMKAALQ